jgi:hypothetical protein
MDGNHRGSRCDERTLTLYIDQLKDAYVRARRFRDPRFRKPSPKHEHFWSQAAKLLCEGGGNPYAFIRWSYDGCAKAVGEGYVNAVTSPKRIAVFLNDRPRQLQQLKLLVFLQADTMKARVNVGESVEEVLTDKRAPLSAIFRFAAAWSSRRFELAAKFRREAERMLLFEPAYKDLLGKYLPEEMLDGAQ